MRVEVHFPQDKEGRKVMTKVYDLAEADVCGCLGDPDPIGCMADKVIRRAAAEWCAHREQKKEECIVQYMVSQGEVYREGVKRAVEGAIREMVARFKLRPLPE